MLFAEAFRVLPLRISFAARTPCKHSKACPKDFDSGAVGLVASCVSFPTSQPQPPLPLKTALERADSGEGCEDGCVE